MIATDVFLARVAIAATIAISARGAKNVMTAIDAPDARTAPSASIVSDC